MRCGMRESIDMEQYFKQKRVKNPINLLDK